MPFYLHITLRLGENLKMKSAHFRPLFNTFQWPPNALKQISHMTWDALYDLILPMWSLLMVCLSAFPEPCCCLFQFFVYSVSRVCLHSPYCGFYLTKFQFVLQILGHLYLTERILNSPIKSYYLVMSSQNTYSPWPEIAFILELQRGISYDPFLIINFFCF